MAVILDVLEDELVSFREVVSSNGEALEMATSGGLFDTVHRKDRGVIVVNAGLLESKETLGGVDVVVDAKI